MEVSGFLPRLVLFGTLISASAHGQFEDINFEDADDELPVVLTAVRLKQLQSDVPASVTVLHGHMLVDLGIRELSEALRLVPGMMVGFDATNKVSVVQYHGGPASLPRNLQVLLDGRSVYHASIAAVDWQRIPVAIEDIERIEVVRGPNASSYGSNAFQAIVNILTKHSADVEGSMVSRKQGDNGVRETFGRHRTQFANTDVRVSVLAKQDDGIAKGGEEYPYESAFIDTQINHRFIDGSDLTVTAIYQETDKPLVSIDGAGDLEFDVQDESFTRQELGLRWDKSLSADHKIKVTSFVSHADHQSRSHVGGDKLNTVLLDPILADWFLRDPDFVNGLTTAISKQQSVDLSGLSASDQLQLQTLLTRYFTDPSDLSTFTGDTFTGEIDNEFRETRFDIELQDTLLLGDHVTLVSGIGFRRDISESQAFFDGYASNNTSRVFSSMDWDSLGNWKAHIGLMWEQESNLDPVFNPRAALIYRIGYNQSVRAVIAKSVRSPDMFETQTHWSYKVENIESTGPVYGDTFYQQVIVDDDLKREEILSRELGYYFLSLNNEWELDVRLFHEQLTNMLDQYLTLDNWYNENRISVFYRGFEFQNSYRPLPDTQLRMTGAFIEAGGSDEEATILRVHAKTSGSLTWIQRWPNQFSTSVGYYMADNYNDFDEFDDRSKYERFDFRIGKRIPLNYDLELDSSLAMQKDLGNEGTVFRNVKYNDAQRYLLSVGLKF